MSGLAARLGRGLREVPLARAAAVRLRTFGRPPGGASDGVLVLFYHRVRAAERGRFERQLRLLRGYGDLVGLTDALGLLAEGRTGGRFICLTFDDGHQDAFDNAVPVLAGQGAPAAFFVVPGWIDDARPGIVDWAQCRQAAAAGIEVGSHTMTHRRLADLDAPEAEAEIAASRARIEAELGQPCRHFACPWGQPGVDYRPAREPALAREVGYRSFLTTIPRRAMAGTDPWAVPRVRMEPGWGTAELRYAFSR